MSGWTCGSCAAENVPGTRFCGYCGTQRGVAAAPEERRLITSLFADLSGFTSLAEQLDAEQLLDVIDPIIGSLSEIVSRYEGHVEKYAGDALLALFGAPVAHDDDAERALRAALDMHEELERICASFPPDRPSLTLHVGITSGHGIARMLGSQARMDYAVLGDSVILAQRLESAAPAGETYVGETTVQLTQHRFELEPVGELTLKGKSEPVPTWRLVGEREPSLTSATQLVGRTRELAFVDELLEGGGVLTLTGEAGVGKSRLAAEARARAEARGMRWLQGRCVSYGSALAYWPYAELLREVAEPERPASPYVDRLLGLDSEVEVEPEGYRRALHGDLVTWLRALAEIQPTVVAVEDVHWADESSLALTGELATLAAETRLALFLVARPEAVSRLDAVASGARSLALEPLDPSDVSELLEHLLDEVPPGLAMTVHERTGGNAFFVGELARALSEHGTAPDELPPTIEGVLAARIDSLSQPAVALLQTASVIGRRVPLPLLTRVTTNVDELEAGIDELVAGGFLDRDVLEARLTFHHALMQDAAYGRLLRRNQRDLHRRVAEEAEALYGAGDDAVELLARHLYLGEAGPKAVEYLVRAAGRAQGLYANDEAIVHLERALELSDSEPELTLSLADLRSLVGDYDEALRLYSEVQSQGHLRAWRGGAATLRKQGRFDDALALLDGAPDDVALQLERGWTLSVAGRYDEASDVLEQALANASEREDDVAGHLRLRLARVETVKGQLGPALAHSLDAERMFDAEQDLQGVATALRVQGNVYFALGRTGDAALVLNRGLSVAERVGNVEELAGCMLNLGMVELALGNVDGAVELDRRAIAEFERIGHGSGRAIANGNLAEKLLEAGQLDEALVHAERALEIAEEIGHTPTVADVQRTQARILLQQERIDEAIERAEQSEATYRRMGADAEAGTAVELAEQARRRRP